MIFSNGDVFIQYQDEGVLRQEHPLHSVAGLLGPLLAINLIHNAKQDMVIPKLDHANHVYA